MSTQIDERVVSMKFDNKQFEAGISQSMKSLEKFDESLKLKDSGKSFRQLSEAANKVDLSGLEKSASSVEVRFSAMSAMAIHQLNRIADAAVDAGARMVKSLSLDQVEAGFQKYTDKTSAVQTIMNATGKSVDQVNAALAKLQWFSDETSYSFVDMTSNVGKFTSAGVELNTAISAMQGIANAAADAGANSVEASRAMYNFSQALGRGYVQLIDWKSIENANMSTITFKDTMIEAGLALGTLVEKNGEYETAAKGSAVSATNFNESLKDGWLTTEVLMKALGKYSAYSDKIYDVSDAFDTCADAMAATSTEGMELGARAFKAAQQAKTFTEAVDATKDAVSSGWMRTFEIIFGDFNESVKLWTDFTNTLWDVFASGADSRNELLKGGLMSGFKQFIEDTNVDAEILKSTLNDVGRAANENFDEMVESAGGFEESLREGWLSSDLLSQGIDKIVSDIQNLSDEELRQQGYTQESITAFLRLKAAVDDGSISLEDFADMMARQSGRENIIEGISNAFEAFWKIVTAVRDAIADLFPAPTVDQIYDMTEKFRDFTADLIISDDAAAGLTSAIKILLSPIKIVVNLIKNAVRILGSFAKLVLKAADALLAFGHGAGPIPDLLKKIFGDERYNRIAEAMATIIDNITTGFKNMVQGIKNTIEQIKNSEQARSILEKLKGILDTIGGGILDAVVAGFEALANLNFNGLGTSAGGALDFILDGLKSFIDFLGKGTQGVTDFFSGIFEGGKEVFDKIVEAIKNFQFSVEDLPEPIQAVISFISSLTQHIVEFVQELTPARILVLGFAAAFVGISFELMGAFAAVQDIMVNTAKLIGTTNAFMGSAKGLVDALKTAFKPDPFLRFAVAVGVTTAALVILSKIPWQTLLSNSAIFVGTVVALTGAMTGFAALSKKFKLGKEMEQMGKSLVLVAAACTLLSASVSLLSMSVSTFGAGSLIASVLAIGVLLAAFVGLAAAMKQIKTTEIAKVSSTVVAFGASIMLMAMGLNTLSKIDTEGLMSNIAALIGVIGAMAVLALGVSAIEKPSFGAVLGLAAGLWLTCQVLKSLSKADPAQLVQGLINMIPVFTAMLGLAVVARVAGDAFIKAGISILAMAAAAVLMQDLITTIAGIEQSSVNKVITVLGSLFIMFAAVTAVSSIAGEHAVGAGVMILGMAGAIMALSIAIEYIGGLDSTVIEKGIGAIVALMAFMSIAIAASHLAGSSAAAINAITISIVALSACIAIMSLITDTEKVFSIASSLGLVIMAIAGMIAATKFVDVKNSLVTILEIGVVMGGMAGILASIASMPNPEGTKTTLEGIALVFTALAATIAVMSHAKNTTAKLTTQLTRMIPIIGIMGAVLLALGAINAFNIKADLETAASLSLLFVSLGAASSAFAKLSQVTKGNNALEIGNALAYIIGIGATATFSLVLVQGVEGAVEKAAALSILFVALSGSAVMLEKFGNVVVPIDWSAVGSSVVLMLGVAATATAALIAVDFATSSGDLIEKAAALSLIIATLGGVAAVLSIFSKGASAEGLSAAAGGILKIAGVITIVVGGISLIGYVLDGLKDDAKESIVNGINFIGDILAAIGEAFGKLMSGTMVGITDGLPKIAENISAFGEKLKPFIETLNSIDPTKALAAVGAISSMLLNFTANNLLNSLANLIPGASGIDLEAIGQSLEDFAPHVVTFCNTLDELNEDTLAKVNLACTAMSTLANSIPVSGGALSGFFGSKDMGKFGEQLKTFGEGFVEFYEVIDGVEGGIDQAVVESCKNAALTMAALADNLPSTGGWLQAILGEKDMAAFGLDLVTFADNFVLFYDKIKDLNVDEKQVNSVANAASMMNELATKLPKTGGWLQDMLGENMTMTSFGSDLVGFAGYFAEFYDKIKDLDISDDKVTTVTNAGLALAGLADAVAEHKIGGIVQAITGEGMTIGQFGSDLVTFAEGMVSFYNVMDKAKDAGSVESTLSVMISNLEYLGENLPDFTGWFNNTDDNMTSIGDSLKALGEGLSAFYASIGTIRNAGDVSKTLELAVSNIKSLVASFTTDGAEGLDTTKIANISSSLTTFASGLKAFFEAISGFKGIIPNPIDEMKLRGEELINALVEGLDSRKEALDTMVNYIFNDLNGAFTSEDNIKKITDSVGSYADHFIETFKDKFGISGADTSTASHSTVFKNIGVNCLEGFKDGLQSKYSDIQTYMRTIAQGCVDAYSQAVGVNSPSVKFMQIGEYCQEGMALGIQNGSKDVLKTTTQFSKDLLDSIKEFFGIESPSVVMKEEVGEYLVQGIAEGITADMSAVEAAAQMAKNITAAFQAEIDKYKADFSTFDLEYQVWEKEHPNAREYEKAQAKLEFYNEKAVDLAKTVTLSEANYKAMLQQFGEDDVNIKEAYNNYLQSKLDLYDLTEQMSEWRSTVQENARAMQELYDKDVWDYYNKNKANGTTYDEAYESLKTAYGDYWDKLFGDPTNGATTSSTGIYDELMAAQKKAGRDSNGEIHVAVDKTLEEAMKEAALAAEQERARQEAARAARVASANHGSGSDSSSGTGGTGSTSSYDEFIRDIGDAAANAGGDEDEKGTSSKGILDTLADFAQWGSDKLGSNVDNFTDWLTGSIDGTLNSKGTEKIVAGGATNIVKYFAHGIDENYAIPVESGKNIISKASQVMGNKDSQKKFEESGMNCVDGFTKGLTNPESIKKVIDASTVLGDITLSSAMTRLGISSPSKEFYAIGQWAAIGFANGIKDNTGLVEKQVTNMCDCASLAAEYASQLLGSDPVKDVNDRMNAKLREEMEALEEAKKKEFFYYNRVFQFDSAGNLVPHGFANMDPEGGSWIVVDDKDLAMQLWDTAEHYQEVWKEEGYASPWHQYDSEDRHFVDDLLEDVYRQSLQNSGLVGVDNFEEGVRYKPSESDETASNQTSISFTQNNYSPNALSRIDIYRDTKTVFSQFANSGMVPVVKASGNDYSRVSESS